MPRTSRRHVDRTAAIKHDQENQGRQGGNRDWYTVQDSDLEKLGIGVYKATAGEKGAARDHYLHILPPHPDDGAPIRMKLFVHFNVGPDEAAYLCPTMQRQVFQEYGLEVPAELAEGECAICERRKGLWAELKAKKDADPNGKYEALENEVSACNYSVRHLMWVVDARDEATEKEGVKYFIAAKTVWDGILDVCKDRRTGEILDITDPDEGKIFIFERKGTGAYDTEYKAFTTEERDPIPDEWLDAVKRYTDVLQFHSADVVRAAFEGRAAAPAASKLEAPADEEPAADASADEEPSRRARRSRVIEEPAEETPPSTRRSRTPAAEEPAAEEPAAEEPSNGLAAVDRIRAKLKARRAAGGEG